MRAAEMGRVLESRAGRRRKLRAEIEVAREAMRLPPLNTERVSLGDLKRIWRRTTAEARAKGLIRG